MPRRRPTQAAPNPNGGGRPPALQPMMVPEGLPYGDRARLEGAQQIVPLQRAPTDGGTGPGPGVPSGPPAPGQTPAPFDFSQVLDAARGVVPSAGGIGGRSQFPEQPITAGLSRGPGPGPEALQHMPRLSDQLAQLARATNRPYLMVLARNARALGR